MLSSGYHEKLYGLSTRSTNGNAAAPIYIYTESDKHNTFDFVGTGERHYNLCAMFGAGGLRAQLRRAHRQAQNLRSQKQRCSQTRFSVMRCGLPAAVALSSARHAWCSCVLR